MNKLRLLIVDDESLIREGIRHGLASRTELEIIGECDSGELAIEAIRSLTPDLVLLDIQMHDCSGLDVVQRIGVDQMPAVVFVTAYDEYAVQAFELNAIDYLLKPFDEERLLRSIARARERILLQREGSFSERLRSLLEAKEKRWPERIVVRNGERFDLVPVSTIDWVESANNYVQLHCGTRVYSLGESLTSLEGRLNPARFMRIHRGRMINLTRVIAIHPMFNGTYEIELAGGLRLGSGRQYKEQIQTILKN